ncbi:serine integrase family protein [Anaeromicropila populeti]|uniref:Recombinase domain-containing protein n=1 Tax=Anaeromicropila populeti TaxID=37658 RepID=A0A1I6LVI5_9FIRM|nr:recombinase [Anaeromicropila populeti]SFS07400.1 hypothetical protein SAMN05661086_03593 [Anaeromicropila populeti]
MNHIPYGYRIVEGQAVVEKEQAAAIREFFNGYLSGLALRAAAEKAGLKLYHRSAGRILRNRHYLGDAYYPAILDQETFEKAEEKRMEKAKSLGRIREREEPQKPELNLQFHLPKVLPQYTDPFKQAEYAYHLIENGVEQNGRK